MMPVITKYVVERNGVEKMTFSSKAEADAYDKLLDMSDELYQVLEESTLVKDTKQRDALAMYLAQNKDSLLVALGAKRKAPPEKSAKNSTAKKENSALLNTSEPLKDIVIEPDEAALVNSDEMLDLDNIDNDMMDINSDEAA
ncbi:YebG family protein [Marinomonas sp. 2405UD68-3]|uniref:YebG family protein n=1 Tax=Marinomonas sp. 2405UD68-3 TaxID=3391835 RepID=UPI0039C943C0